MRMLCDAPNTTTSLVSSRFRRYTYQASDTMTEIESYFPTSNKEELLQECIQLEFLREYRDKKEYKLVDDFL